MNNYLWWIAAMGYSHFHADLLLAIVAEAQRFQAAGIAEAIDVGKRVAPNVPDHVVRATVEDFIKQKLLENFSRPLDGRVFVRVTDKAYATADTILAS